jgi:hypothetical protein
MPVSDIDWGLDPDVGFMHEPKTAKGASRSPLVLDLMEFAATRAGDRCDVTDDDMSDRTAGHCYMLAPGFREILDQV